jgi:hypothetical protein
LGPFLGQSAAAVFAARLIDARAESGVPTELLGRRETTDVANLRGDGVGEDPADARNRHEVGDVGMLSTEGTQLELTAVDLHLELIDEAQAGFQCSEPGFGNVHCREPTTAFDAEEVRCRALVTEGQQGGVDAGRGSRCGTWSASHHDLRRLHSG